eukprot:jgi/Mesvir1/4701/Mv05627-RA.1
MLYEVIRPMLYLQFCPYHAVSSGTNVVYKVLVVSLIKLCAPLATSGCHPCGMQAESPHIGRLAHLTDRLSRLQDSLEVERAERTNSLSARLQLFSDRVDEADDGLGKTHHALQAQLATLSSSVDADVSRREALEGGLAQQARALGEKHAHELETLRKERKAGESKMRRLLVAEAASLQGEISAESLARVEQGRACAARLEDELPRLAERAAREEAECGAREAALLLQAGARVQQLRKEIEDESNACRQLEQSMVAMLQGTVACLQKELEIERKERLKTEELLVQLIEDTCAKFIPA